MQAFIDFLVNNYLWFLVISLILVFALIGYLVGSAFIEYIDKFVPWIALTLLSFLGIKMIID